MLTITTSMKVKGRRHNKQGGVVLFVALIVLVAMTLAGIALMRSVDTNNIIAGNLAFQQSATHSGDLGVQDAIAWVSGIKGNTSPTLPPNKADSTHGYAANGNAASRNPAAGQSWDAYWTQSLANRAYSLTKDEAGNTVSYVIDRMCDAEGPFDKLNCTQSPLPSLGPTYDAGGSYSRPRSNDASAAPLVGYYRITVRVAGPRNTVSYVQAMVLAYLDLNKT